MRKAVELFNEESFASVTLFEIAKHLKITRGNLTYHFKDKDLLLAAIAEELWEKIVVDRNRNRPFPSFENLHNEIQLYYRFQCAYRFIFLDHHVLNHPAIKDKFREMTHQYIRECEVTIAFAISVGNMHPEPYEGMYHDLAFTTWMVSFYWLNQQLVRGEAVGEDSEGAAMKIWSMLLPHLTDKGLKAFRDYFGNDYLKQLGDSFEADMAHYVKF